MTYNGRSSEEKDDAAGGSPRMLSLSSPLAGDLPRRSMTAETLSAVVRMRPSRYLGGTGVRGHKVPNAVQGIHGVPAAAFDIITVLVVASHNTKIVAKSRHGQVPDPDGNVHLFKDQTDI